MNTHTLKTQLLTLALIVSFLSCTSEEETTTEEPNNTSWTITVMAYTLDNDVYTETGNVLIFDSETNCQTWSRTAQSDSHDANTHLHYNAAAAVSYNNDTSTFTWTEYGPETDQSTIESTCLAATGGVTKTVNNTSYYQDKPNVYLKITTVVAQ